MISIPDRNFKENLYYNERENTLNIKPTQHLLSQLIPKEKDVSDPKQVCESNYHVLVSRNLVHRVVLILYSISIFFAMPRHSLASTRLARRRPKVLQALEILESYKFNIDIKIQPIFKTEHLKLTTFVLVEKLSIIEHENLLIAKLLIFDILPAAFRYEAFHGRPQLF